MGKLKLALDHNPTLARTYFDFAASDERVGVIEGELRPSLDLLAVEGREDRQTPTTNFGRYDRSNVRFTATQLLFDGNATRDRLRATEFEARRDFQQYVRAADCGPPDNCRVPGGRALPAIERLCRSELLRTPSSC